MISQLFILAPNGHTIVHKDYRGEVPKEASEVCLLRHRHHHYPITCTVTTAAIATALTSTVATLTSTTTVTRSSCA